MTKALYDLLCGLHLEEQMKSSKAFEEAGEELLASRYRQIYKS
ncbi:hypothetical protein [Ruminococcus sp.]